MDFFRHQRATPRQYLRQADTTQSGDANGYDAQPHPSFGEGKIDHRPSSLASFESYRLTSPARRLSMSLAQHKAESEADCSLSPGEEGVDENSFQSLIIPKLASDYRNDRMDNSASAKSFASLGSPPRPPTDSESFAAKANYRVSFLPSDISAEESKSLAGDANQDSLIVDTSNMSPSSSFQSFKISGPANGADCASHADTDASFSASSFKEKFPPPPPPHTRVRLPMTRNPSPSSQVIVSLKPAGHEESNDSLFSSYSVTSLSLSGGNDLPESSDSELLRDASSRSLIAGSSSEKSEADKLGIEDFEMLSVLGRGSFGAVMLVRHRMDRRIFAIKILKKTTMDASDISNAMHERKILQQIRHPFISSLIFAFQTDERLYLGMKFYAAGDLFYHLNVRGHLPTDLARFYTAELVLAISYLHSLDILYRDLKPSNIMIDADGHVGLVDFGLSRPNISGYTSGAKTLSGTAEYVAPEALVQYEDGARRYGKAFDWWSLGIVLFEMLAGESPFYDENEMAMLKRIVYEPIKYPSSMSKEAKDLLAQLLEKDPEKRLGSGLDGLKTIQTHPFFSDIDWNLLYSRKVSPPWLPQLSSETDTRYVDPEFGDDPSWYPGSPTENSKTNPAFGSRFSQFSFDARVDIQKQG